MTRPIYTGVDQNHPLASPMVVKLASDLFAVQQIIAEALLGAKPPAFTDADMVTLAQIAIVRQINFQVAQGIDPMFTAAATSGAMRASAVYRDRWLDPVAAELWASIGSDTSIDQLLDKYSEAVRSVRREGCEPAVAFDPNCTDRRYESRYFRHVFD